MKITYDASVDAAYIKLIENAVHTETYVCEDLPGHVKGDVFLDFTPSGQLAGIEVLNASKAISKQLLDEAVTD